MLEKGLLLALCAAMLLSRCGSVPQVRYKVTVAIDDHGMTRTGSSVWQWSLHKPSVALATSYGGEFHGDAVTVRLQDGRRLFALLRGDDGVEGAAAILPERVFGDIGRSRRGEPVRHSDRVDDLRDIASRPGERAVLNCVDGSSDCPMLVAFDDPRRPHTVRRVSPSALARVFGPGVRLRSISVEITREPVSRTVMEELDWLATQAGALAQNAPGVAIGDGPLAGRLHEGDFSQ